jgi:hypothetical protein
VSIFTIFFIVLLIAWLLGVGVFHVAGALIHILLVLTAVSLILHFVRGARTAWDESLSTPRSHSRE